MKKLLALCVASALVAASTFPAIGAGDAPDKPTQQTVLTTAQALTILQGLRNLDGHQVIAKQNGQDTMVVVPWDFKNGSLRLAIANNIALLTLVEAANEKALAQIRLEVFKGQPPKENSPEVVEFQRQYSDAMARPVPGAMEKLERIKGSALKLDVNEIPGTTLGALGPILDRDDK